MPRYACDTRGKYKRGAYTTTLADTIFTVLRGLCATNTNKSCTQQTVSTTTTTTTTTTAAPYLSCAPVLTKPSFFTTVIPEHTRPKIVCLPSNHGVGASVMKNWLRLVFGPAFACSIAHAGKTAASLQ